MWNNTRSLDYCSLGIEVVGYHNRSITEAQVSALRELLAELQAIYDVPDSHVLCHAMVAYGAPNRWHRKSHRGRKRCGMLFADRALRLRLGLTSQPVRDPDVGAGRLAIADPYLAQMLYGSALEQQDAVRHYSGAEAFIIGEGRSAWDIARDKYDSEDTVYVFPGGTRRSGAEISDWKRIPPGTRVLLTESGQSENAGDGVKVLGPDGSTASEVAGDEYNQSTTIYFLPSGRVLKGDEMSDGDFHKLAAGTKVLVGYVDGGYITATRSAFDVCGERWALPATYYRLAGGDLVSGETVDEGSIPKGTRVFFQH
jgi:hypothetical protein